MVSLRFKDVSSSLVFIGAIALGLVAYWPGLAGPFLFDDFANLKTLGDVGGVEDFRSFLHFVLGGIAGPTGRPLSLVTFLLNDVTWPSDPYSFKRTNVLLHALNGALLCWICFLICHRYCHFDYRQSAWISIVAFALWYLHPFLVSTTLLVIQRMAMLAATFVFIGVLTYLRGRLFLDEGRKPAGYFLMTASIVIATILAMLAKENGALLPILIGTLEYTICRHARPNSTTPHRIWSSVFIWMPFLSLVTYFAWRVLRHYPYSLEFSRRDFSVYERAITQPRILIDYLQNLFLPRAGTNGLYHDNYVFSTSLTDPPSTWIFLLLLTIIISSAIILRRSFPVVAFSILFFFAAHLLESTIVGLELYFEHRNYLPASFLFLPVAVGLFQLRIHSAVRSVAVLSLVGVTAALTFSRASTWSDELLLHGTWVQRNPESVRAQQGYAGALMRRGFQQKALEALRTGKELAPQSIDLHLFYLRQKCLVEGAAKADLENVIDKIERYEYQWKQFEFLEWVIRALPTDACNGLGFEDALRVIDALTENIGTRRPSRQMLAYHLRGVVLTDRGDASGGLESFSYSLEAYSNIETGLFQVAYLATHGFYNEALVHLERVEDATIRKRDAFDDLVSRNYEAEIDTLRNTIRIDLARKQGGRL